MMGWMMTLMMSLQNQRNPNQTLHHSLALLIHVWLLIDFIYEATKASRLNQKVTSPQPLHHHNPLHQLHERYKLKLRMIKHLPDQKEN